mgnify:CR=1 FL=1
MNTSLFISKRIRFKGGLAMVCIAISYLVMIIAVSVSSGFRREIRSGISTLSGDVRLTPPNLNVLDHSRPIEKNPSYLSRVEEVEGVEAVVPAVYMAGIIKQGTDIYGVLFKAVSDGVGGVSIPRTLAEKAGVDVGESLTAYFVGERVNARKFDVVSVYDSMIEADDKLVVYADMADLQRLGGWSSDQVSAMEIILDRLGWTAVETFQTIHNYIDVNEMILRKGAVSAKAGEKLLIPINMRDGSLICIGKGNEDWNCSAPHGAGRLLSRTAAFEQLTMAEYEREMAGIYSTCVVPDTLDESPMAYKSIDEIVENIAPTAEIVCRIKPLYNFKAAE